MDGVERRSVRKLGGGGGAEQLSREDALVDLRVHQLLDERLAASVYEARAPVELAAWSPPGEPVSRDEGLSGAFAPFDAATAWGTAWGTTWFRIRGVVPVSWRDKFVSLHVEIVPATSTGVVSEALACDASGNALQGITSNHPDVLLLGPARGGERIECFLEAASNPSPPRPVYDWPLLLPEPGSPALCRISCDLVVRSAEVRALVEDLRALTGLLSNARLERSRAAEVRVALSRACDALDAWGVPGGLKAARSALEDALSRPAHASAHRVTACGHSHIDSAWLWPLREGRRKCVRTFATAVALMDTHPDYRFAASSAQHFAWVKHDDPLLYERVREKVKKGRFIPVGGFWVECDVNVPLGESLVRQLVYGVRFFEKEFSVQVEEGWLPDAFGYSANLPQLLRQAGLSNFLTQKLATNELNRFPYSSFLWEGIDGSRIFTHFPPTETYSGQMSQAELAHGIEVFAEHGRATRSLYLFGFGDGGGGPTVEMIEAARRFRDLEGSPAVQLGNPRDFLREARAEFDDPPVWSGELYLERHRGAYTTQAATKASVRRAELALRAAEIWSVLSPGGLSDYPQEALEGAWKTLLLNQFHDIVPGTSIHWVHRQAEAELREVCARADAITTRALGRLAASVGTDGMTTPFVVANSQGHARVDLVTLPIEAVASPGQDLSGDLVALGPDGMAGPVQLLADGQFGFVAHVPSLGFACYDLRPLDKDEDIPDSGLLEVGSRRLENQTLRVELDDDGLLRSVWDKRAEREALAGPANLLQLFPDYPSSNDAWDIDAAALGQPEDITTLDELVIEESGPLRATIRLSRHFRSSTITQRLSLGVSSPWLDIESDIEWHERHRLLKVAFPLAVRSPRASYEIAFGIVERPTHRNTSWDAARFEVCAHRFVDLSESGYGVALANDAKYGCDVAGNVIRLSLLRAPTAPDPSADQGHHNFSYRFIPHSGGLGPGRVVEAAHDLNDLLRVSATTAHPGRSPRSASLVSVEPPNMVVDTIKRSDDKSSVTLRCYEAWGGRGRARLRLPGNITSVARTDLLETPQGDPMSLEEGIVEFPVSPFQLVTLKAATNALLEIPHG